MSSKRLALPSAEEIAGLPADGGAEFNRLVFESSPYLLQHCRNPVDWYPWGDEAFARAKAENKPVFLSIGYSTCYWCHVMERESFEDPAVAEIMNKYYICIKVDREERPDVDSLYVTATQMMLGHAGWPDNVWLNEIRQPWFSSTYVPKEDGEDGIGFKSLLVRLADRYKADRAQIDDMAARMTEEMDRYNKPRKTAEPGLDRTLIAKPLRALSFAFDSVNGGVGQAPKFPPHGAMALWCYEYRHAQDPKILEKIVGTLDGMAKGGIHDQVGGGFHRYSTDREWMLPHFEKMLYDNAQLGRAYVDGWLLVGRQEYAGIARGTYDWALREMRNSAGGFYCAIDAETDGEEGIYYTFTTDEVVSLLGKAEGEWFSETFNFEPAGNYFDERSGHQTGKNILYRKSLENLAALERVSVEDVSERLNTDLKLLLSYRLRRVAPHIDDKVICSWNALMIGSLAYGARHLDEPRYAKAAAEAADFILEEMHNDGRLAHSWRAGRLGSAAFLDDYALMSQALIELYQTTGEQRWLDASRMLLTELKQHYEDAEGGGYFYAANDREKLINRSKSGTDDVVPSGNGAAAQVFAQFAAMEGAEADGNEARKIIETFSGQMNEAPLSTTSLYVALAMLADNASSPGDPGQALTGEDSGGSVVSGKPDARSLQQPVEIDLYVASHRARPGDSVKFALQLNLDEGFHVNSHSPLQDFLLPCNIVLEAQPGISLGEVQYPLGAEFRASDSLEPQSVYLSGTWIHGTLDLARDLGSGRHTVNLTVGLQPCNERECLLAQTHRLELQIDVSPDAQTEIAHGDLFGPAKRHATGAGAGDSAALPLSLCAGIVTLSLLAAFTFRSKRRRRA